MLIILISVTISIVFLLGFIVRLILGAQFDIEWAMTAALWMAAVVAFIGVLLILGGLAYGGSAYLTGGVA